MCQQVEQFVVDDLMLFFQKIYHWQASEFTGRLLIVILSYFVVILGIDLLEYKTQSHTFILKLQSKAMQYGILAALFFMVLVYMLQSDNEPFIYFQF